ncbi:golgin Putative 2 [Actinidia rufa]|uniref:Golgin Putative 2 n=1 Tax=Actinidia rufa TaxID=165716 RepID=A0A7J0GNC5_9ERIC|nr:golgin Putative 2 [Actinidia rufa]
MAGWISSKIKVAETFLQQASGSSRYIDQQAAESLKRNDKSRSDDLSSETPRKTTEVLPLKDQLKKKKNKTTETNDLIGRLSSDRNLNEINGNNNKKNGEKEDNVGALTVNAKSSVNPPKSRLTDSDWTELLSAPSRTVSVNRSNGVSGIRGLRNDGRRQGGAGSNLKALEGKKNNKGQNTGLRASPKSNVVSENKINGGRSIDGEDSRVWDTMPRISREKVGSDDCFSEGRESDEKEASLSRENKNVAGEEKSSASETYSDKEGLQSKGSSPGTVPQSTDRGSPVVEWYQRLLMGFLIRRWKRRGSPSISDGGSDSETDSTSSSDSESERKREEQRRRRAQVLAEKAAAKAIEAIKERENMVARLEGEKQSLEKILEERAKQQAQESFFRLASQFPLFSGVLVILWNPLIVFTSLPILLVLASDMNHMIYGQFKLFLLQASELQNTMMEMMDAAELEKQKHNNTRMEALTRMAKLETANADLARSLASMQWSLEVEGLGGLYK